MWPHMMALNVLQSYYEHSGDPRVIPCLTRYFRWQLNWKQTAISPAIAPGPARATTWKAFTGFTIARARRGSWNWPSKIHRWARIGPEASTAGMASISRRAFASRPNYYLQSGDRKDLDAAERNYRTVMDIYGQFPGGGFAARRELPARLRRSAAGIRDLLLGRVHAQFPDAHQDFRQSAVGRPLRGDRLQFLPGLDDARSEGAALPDRAKPAAARPAATSRRASAMAAPMFIYSPWEFRCCQHNVSHGWPYYAEELWLATADSGLCTSLYAASEVTAKVGDGTVVTVAETTDYPFDETVELKLAMPKARSVSAVSADSALVPASARYPHQRPGAGAWPPSRFATCGSSGLGIRATRSRFACR